MSNDRAELQKPLAGAPRFVREVSTQAGRPFRHVVATRWASERPKAAAGAR